MAERQDGRTWWPIDVWLALHGHAVASWPAPADGAPRFDYQRPVELPPAPRRPRPGPRSQLDLEAEQELMRRILEP